jgi:hypothetical protein
MMTCLHAQLSVCSSSEILESLKFFLCIRSSREGTRHSGTRKGQTGQTPEQDWIKEESKVAAQYAINVLRPKPDGHVRESREGVPQMPEKTTSRVSRANRNPPTAEIPQISPASKVVNALRAKVDQTKRTPPLSKAKDSHVGFLSLSLSLSLADAELLRYLNFYATFSYV